MTFVASPWADPISFIVGAFVFGIPQDPLGTLLKLAVLASVIIFPFTWIGKLVYDWVSKNAKANHLVSLFLTSFITVFVFIIVIRLWYVLLGSQFLAVGIVDFVIDFIIAGAVAFLFALLGDFINHIVHQKWQVPQALTLYMIDLIVCLVFFISVLLAIYAYAAVVV